MTQPGLKDQEQSMDSHLKQFRQPLYSTAAFEEFLNRRGCFKARKILDIGCGCGAVTNYMASRHADVQFLGMDYNDFLIRKGREIPENSALPNLRLEPGNWFDPPRELKGQVDGIYNVHTLCCFKRFEPAFDSLLALGPEWLAFTSLFYEGPLDVLIHIRDHNYPLLTDDNPDADFNTFSLTAIQKYLAERGYSAAYERFDIPAALPKPSGGQRGTYTVQTEWSPRSQFSGPVYLPWYFLLAKKSSY